MLAEKIKDRNALSENVIHHVNTVTTLAESLVLIVDDDPISREILHSMLSVSFHCEVLESGAQVIPYCEARKPDLIVLDMQMPGLSGIEVCTQLKCDSRFSDVPTIFVTADTETKTQDLCWEAGASDFVTKPVTASTLRHRVTHQIQNKKRIDLLHHLTYHDQLTGVHNRHFLASEFPDIVRRTAREKAELCVIMIDIDHFKGFNDTYGHQEGDSCLKMVAETIGKQLQRPDDFLVRFGGEEFCIFLPNTNEQGGRHIIKKILSAVRNLKLRNVSSPLGVLTVSAGYCIAKPNNETDMDNLILAADFSLLDAKEAGKNQFKGCKV